MRDKRRIRWIEWGKDILILLLVCSLVLLVGQTRLFGKAGELFSGSSGEGGGTASGEGASVKISPMRLAVYHDGLRWAVQYDQAAVDEGSDAFAVLFAEAMSSAGAAEQVSERVWRQALCSTGIYMDFYYPVPMGILAGWLGGDSGAQSLTGSVRRICLAADDDGGVSLYYADEGEGTYYACATTLSRGAHLDAAVEGWSPNGAQFAFEVAGMEALEPYTLLTTAPEPVVYAAANPLLEEEGRVKELLSALSFHSGGSALSASAGGQLVEGSDSLRLWADGTVSFHTIGASEYRFEVSGQDVRSALEYVQTLAENTAGAWCGQAQLRLSELAVDGKTIKISFQYCLNGMPVRLPEGVSAASFTVSGGAVTDFSLCLRSYTDTGETGVVLPVVQASAAMESLNVRGRELTLSYEDTGAEQVTAGWIAG